MKITLANGAELNPILVTGSHKYVQGQNRDTLSFVFPASAGMDALDAAFTSAACEVITIQEDSGTEFIHQAYTVRAELKKEAVETAPATAEAPAAYEERITVSMSQRNYSEGQIASLQDTVDTLVLDTLLGGEDHV